MPDNFRFDITGAPLEACMAIAAPSNRKAVAWSVTADGTRLVLHWTTGATGANPLPAPLGGDALVLFIRSWLATVDYGPEPDIDGSCSKGWRVFNEAWGHVDGHWQAFVGIEPAWLLHGK